MTIKIIASDMDGTFLDEKGQYDRTRFEKILKELRARNIRFVAASGNNIDRLKLMFKGFDKDVTFVAENGAHLVENGQTIVYQTLPKSELEAFIEYYGDKLADYRAVVSGKNSSYRLKSADFSFRPSMITAEEFDAFFSKIVALDDFSQIPKDEAICKMTMMVFDDHAPIVADFNENFSGNLVAISSGYGALDFIERGIHKAWGLERLMERHGIQPDQVMTFGDGGNDMEMLQLATHSYAVDNASNQVKAAAKHIIASNKENAVMQVIEDYLSQNQHP